MRKTGTTKEKLARAELVIFGDKERAITGVVEIAATNKKELVRVEQKIDNFISQMAGAITAIKVLSYFGSIASIVVGLAAIVKYLK